MWHRREIGEIVQAEPDYITPDDTYHRLRRQRIQWRRKFFNLDKIPFLTRLRQRVSMWNIRNELSNHVRQGKLSPYSDSVLMKP